MAEERRPAEVTRVNASWAARCAAVPPDPWANWADVIAAAQRFSGLDDRRLVRLLGWRAERADRIGHWRAGQAPPTRALRAKLVALAEGKPLPAMAPRVKPTPPPVPPRPADAGARLPAGVSWRLDAENIVWASHRSGAVGVGRTPDLALWALRRALKEPALDTRCCRCGHWLLPTERGPAAACEACQRGTPLKVPA